MARAPSSQRSKRGKSASSKPGKPKSNEPATHETEELPPSLPVVISSGNESSDDDGSAQVNSDNSGSMRSKELIAESENLCRAIDNERLAKVRSQREDDEDMDDSASCARTTGDQDGQLDFVGNEQPQAHTAEHPITKPTRQKQRSEIPDSEGSDDEDSRHTPIGNADRNAIADLDTNADPDAPSNAYPNANPDADPEANPHAHTNADPNTPTQTSRALYNVADTPAHINKSSSEREASMRTGDKRKAPTLSRNTQRRRVRNGLSKYTRDGDEVRDFEADPLNEGRTMSRKYGVDSAFYGRPPIIEGPTQAAVLDSFYDSVCTRNHDAPEASLQYSSPHGDIDFEKVYRRRPQSDTGRSANGGVAPQVDCREASSELSDTTQDMGGSSRSPQWHLSNAVLEDSSLGEGCSMKFKISGPWKLTLNGKLSGLGSEVISWELLICGRLKFVKSDSIIDIRFGLPWIMRPVA